MRKLDGDGGIRPLQGLYRFRIVLARKLAPRDILNLFSSPHSDTGFRRKIRRAAVVAETEGFEAYSFGTPVLFFISLAHKKLSQVFSSHRRQHQAPKGTRCCRCGDGGIRTLEAG